ncbi:Y-family DNA polymerase [Faunimonas sp. B44]|uniref:Y-family DNA polymerase n=1 Tax=Faunimonas sp. B44 TaxID=3461493 RepID=UPI004043A2AF
MRILSLWLPRLPTDRLIRRERAGGAPPEGRPRAIVARADNALRVVAVDAVAHKRGVKRGSGLADARAAVPDLVVDEADEAGDRAFLDGLADWCSRYTPLVSLDPPDGLFLDVTGCTHLFGRNGADGEAGLRADLLARVSAQGFAAEAAVAATAGAAWAAARFEGPAHVPAGGEADALGAMPVAALRISEAQRALLDRLGLKRIGQLVGQPRAPLAARFGRSLLDRLDQALGAADEVLSPVAPPPVLSAERRFAEPVTDGTMVQRIVRSLCETLAPSMERRGVGARALQLALYRVDGGVARVSIGTGAPVREPARIASLFAERLAVLGDRIDPGFGFDLARLAVEAADPLAPAQIDLAGEREATTDVEQLVDRLGARLGTNRVARLVPVESHVPERAVIERPLAATAAAPAAWPEEDPGMETPTDRPVRLLARPEPVEVLAEVPEGPPLRFRWRRVVHEVARAEGPERIAPEWWRAEDEDAWTRDYFRVEDAAGRRYWIFRSGLYGAETSAPAWYLHGLFA